MVEVAALPICNLAPFALSRNPKILTDPPEILLDEDTVHFVPGLGPKMYTFALVLAPTNATVPVTSE